MLNALFNASVLVSVANFGMSQSAYKQRTLNETAMLVARLQYGIMRRYIRLQQENARLRMENAALRGEVTYWLRALKDTDHA